MRRLNAGAERVSMYKPWTRDDTKEFIHIIESRIEDIDYYLKRTVEWCEKHEVVENKRVIMCCLVTCIWVSSMRNEAISFQELIEYVGIEDDYEDLITMDKVYKVCKEFQDLEHEEVLQMLINKADGWENYLLS